VASYRKEIIINVAPQVAWTAICDLGSVHRLFPGVLTASHVDGDARVVTFANGMTVRERIIDRDDDAMRFVYAAVEGGITTHHNASWQLFAAENGATRFVWISDFVPDEAAPPVRELVDAGSAVMKKVLESR
jgi:carbon monoxide dehydrogenase subunit G